jgi:hypothetical protein
MEDEAAEEEEDAVLPRNSARAARSPSEEIGSKACRREPRIAAAG